MILAIVVLIILFVPAGCGQETAPDIPAAENGGSEAPVSEGPLMARVDEAPAIDGLTAGYPAEPLEVMGGVIHMAHDGETLYLHFELAVEGWISIGFNRTGGGMDGANMIIGYLDNGSPAYREDLGSGRSHEAVAEGAMQDFYLGYSEGVAIMEFAYPLEFPSGQGYNLDGLDPGQKYTLILAAHNSSQEIDRSHSSRGSAEFTVEP
jgi:hypothetical protein